MHHASNQPSTPGHTETSQNSCVCGTFQLITSCVLCKRHVRHCRLPILVATKQQVSFINPPTTEISYCHIMMLVTMMTAGVIYVRLRLCTIYQNSGQLGKKKKKAKLSV